MEIIHRLILQAIEGETGAEAQYQAFAERALRDGFVKVATLFTALSRAEAIHIANHQRALEKNGYTKPLPEFDITTDPATTRENLVQAIEAEYEEFQEMYPSFRRQIQKQFGNVFSAKIALLSLKWASESEANHHALLKSALRAVSAGRDVEGGNYYLCSVCGNIEFSKSHPEKLCEVCGHDISFYAQVKV